MNLVSVQSVATTSVLVLVGNSATHGCYYQGTGLSLAHKSDDPNKNKLDSF